jgi:hypothetical protein
MSGDHNMYQKDKSYLDFECPRCGHCCQAAGEEHMTKLEAWKAWCESAGTPDLATEFTLEQSSHGKAFSFAWERGFVDGMQHQMRLSVEKTLETEQAKEEPVAWRSTSPDGKLSNEFVGTSKEVNWTPIYTEPPKRELTCVCGAVWEGETMVHSPREREWVGLTDEEINSVCHKRDWTATWTDTTFARAIEAKLREKNT